MRTISLLLGVFCLASDFFLGQANGQVHLDAMASALGGAYKMEPLEEFLRRGKGFLPASLRSVSAIPATRAQRRRRQQ